MLKRHCLNQDSRCNRNESFESSINIMSTFTLPLFLSISPAMSMMMTTKPTLTPTRMRGGPVVLAV